MYILRDYQQAAHDATIEHCKVSTKPIILNQSVGAGKTLQIAFMAKHVADKGGKVLVLARQGELIEQDSQDYWEIGGKCSVFSASLGRKSTFYPVIMGTEGTVRRALHNEFKGLSFSLLCVDEAHEIHTTDAVECIEAMKSGEDFYEAKNEAGKPKFSQYSVIIAHLLKLNPNMRIVGYSGSPFRGSESIIGDFWEKSVSDVHTYYLIEQGYLVPPVFGFGDDSHMYDLKEFNPSSNQNAGDFSSKELAAMGRKITKDITTTQIIMEEVIERTRDRLGVLITCAGKKHCNQVAECLPPDSWGIVTDSTTTKERMRILKSAYDGKIKYVIQINCLGQGVNIPRWDTCVILRKIGSLRYLIQLTGRVLRTLKPAQIESGLTKNDALILDYSETMESMGDIYDDPILNKALAQKAQEDGEFLECPACETKNSKHAIRCIGGGLNRCDYYFKFRECKICKTHNAPSARECRECQSTLIDPNAALINKAYTEADFKPVLSVKYEKTKAGDGICVEYRLDATYFKYGIEYPEVAREYFKPFNKEAHNRGKWSAFITAHINGERFRQSVYRMRTLDQIIQNKAMFDVPKMITHRVNDKGFSIINRKEFLSGRISE